MVEVKIEHITTCMSDDEYEDMEDLEYQLKEAGSIASALHTDFLHKTDEEKTEQNIYATIEKLQNAQGRLADREYTQQVSELLKKLDDFKETVKDGSWPDYKEAEQAMLDIWNVEAKVKEFKIDAMFNCLLDL